MTPKFWLKLLKHGFGVLNVVTETELLRKHSSKLILVVYNGILSSGICSTEL